MQMVTHYPKYLQTSVNKHLKKYLDPTSREMVISQAKKIESVIKSSSRKKKWSFTIDRSDPITFTGINIGKSVFEVDYACEIEGEADKIISSKFQTRVWTKDKELCYRKKYDSPEIKVFFEKYGWKRVILRFRIESRIADVKHLELSHHMHIGGDQGENEYCWINDSINEPRILFPPMDFILFSEFIALNYYFEDYQILYKDSEWIRLVKNSQKLFQQTYYQKCQDMLKLERDTDTIISHFCK